MRFRVQIDGLDFDSFEPVPEGEFAIEHEGPVTVTVPAGDTAAEWFGNIVFERPVDRPLYAIIEQRVVGQHPYLVVEPFEFRDGENDALEVKCILVAACTTHEAAVAACRLLELG